jgi:hypothetical protein
MPCLDCVYFNNLSLSLPAEVELAGEAVGECRRTAPPASPPGIYDLARPPRWPRLVASEWCGEYRVGPPEAAKHAPKKVAPPPAPPPPPPPPPPPVPAGRREVIVGSSGKK